MGRGPALWAPASGRAAHSHELLLHAGQQALVASVSLVFVQHPAVRHCVFDLLPQDLLQKSEFESRDAAGRGQQLAQQQLHRQDEHQRQFAKLRHTETQPPGRQRCLRSPQRIDAQQSPCLAFNPPSPDARPALTLPALLCVDAPVRRWPSEPPRRNPRPAGEALQSSWS